MSNDDDTFLSAYLDGELDLDQQQQADSVLVSSPELSERLRGLSVVRELVAGLHREAGGDVVPAVMHRIRLRTRSRSLFTLWRPRGARTRQAAAAAGMLAAAAGVVLVVNLAILVRPQVHRIAPAADATLDNVITDAKSGEHVVPDTDLGPVIALEPDSRSSSTSAAAAGSIALDTSRTAIEHGAAPAAGNAGTMADDFGASRTLLDRPYRRRFFVSKNGGGRNAQQQVASVVEHTTRYGFFKITVSRGIVIDPRHPEEATVFALLVKPGDLDRLRDQLKVALPDLIEERTADPAIITQLADIGQVQSLSPAPLADVSISREALALRVRTGDGADSGPQQSSAAVQQALPTAEQFRSAPLPVPGRSGGTGESERGTDLAAAEDSSHVSESPSAAGKPSAEPISGTQVALSRSDKAAQAPGRPTR